VSIPTRVCANPVEHRPTYIETDLHHVRPTYLALLLYPGLTRTQLFAAHPETRETVSLCNNDHDAIHHLLEHLISEGQTPGHRRGAGYWRWIDEAWAWWQEEAVK
jgi:hypothetical protein